MEALGRLFNVIPVASGKHISLKNASGVTFIIYEDGATDVAFKESIGGQSEQPLAVINHFYANSGLGSVWVRHTNDSGGNLDNEDTINKVDTLEEDCIAVYIGADMLSEGFDSVECTDASAVVIAIVHDLLVQRAPQNLPVFAV